MNANELFNDIYKKLIVYHQQNEVYVINKKDIKRSTLNKLKGTLDIERIDFIEDESQLICTINERRKGIAKEVYTPETIKKLEEEERRVNEAFMKNFFIAVDK